MDFKLLVSPPIHDFWKNIAEVSIKFTKIVPTTLLAVLALNPLEIQQIQQQFLLNFAS